MTVLFSAPSNTYPPGTYNMSATVGSGYTRLKLSLTRESWPAGNVGSLGIHFPDGSAGPSITFDGGVAHNKNGTVATQSFFTVELLSNGVPQVLPAGSYAVHVQILQTVSTAVTVEGF